ncbi:MAG: hypothetical protein HOH65_08355 [Rhodospirillaceae bacterium]|nr:hypothetical protein [Rhodospirillaceae bacterium]
MNACPNPADPGLTNQVLHQAQALRQQGELNEALDLLRQTAKTNTGFSQLWEFNALMGAMLLSANHLDDASAHIERALRTNPGHAPALYGLFQCDYRRKNYPKALHGLRKAICLAPEHAGYIEHLSLAAAATNDFDLARRSYLWSAVTVFRPTTWCSSNLIPLLKINSPDQSTQILSRLFDRPIPRDIGSWLVAFSQSALRHPALIESPGIYGRLLALGRKALLFDPGNSELMWQLGLATLASGESPAAASLLSKAGSIDLGQNLPPADSYMLLRPGLVASRRVVEWLRVASRRRTSNWSSGTWPLVALSDRESLIPAAAADRSPENAWPLLQLAKYRFPERIDALLKLWSTRSPCDADLMLSLAGRATAIGDNVQTECLLARSKCMVFKRAADRSAELDARIKLSRLSTPALARGKTPTLFIHAGLAKCASSWMQTHVFPHLRGTRYGGRRSFILEGFNHHMTSEFRMDHPDEAVQCLTTAASINTATRDTALDGLVALAKDQGRLLVSAEVMGPTTYIPVLSTIARMRARGLDLRLIVATRGPADLFQAAYFANAAVNFRPASHMLVLETSDQKFFATNHHSQFGLPTSALLPSSYFNTQAMLSLCKRVLGEDAVLELPLEQLRADAPAFLGRLFGYIGGQPEEMAGLIAALPQINRRRSDQRLEFERRDPTLSETVTTLLDHIEAHPFPYTEKDVLE